MSGRAQVSFKKVHINKNRPGGVLNLQISKNGFSLFTDIIYSRISANYARPPVSVNIVNKFGIFTGALAFELYQWQLTNSCDIHHILFEPYLGFRHTLKKTNASVSGTWINSGISHNQSWTDPIFGLRLTYALKAFRLLLTGDVGGTNSKSDYSYQTSGLIGYNLQTRFSDISFYLGYKILDQHYIHGHNANFFDWNVKLSGPLAGIAISF